MKTSALILGLSLIFTAGCSSSGTDVDPSNLEPTFSSIQTEVFANSCTFTACHNEASAKGNMALTANSAYGDLVDVLADNDVARAAGKKRVVPGDPDNSFIIQKLEGPGDGEGDRMPDNRNSLSQETIDVIRQWITDGALNN